MHTLFAGMSDIFVEIVDVDFPVSNCLVVIGACLFSVVAYDSTPPPPPPPPYGLRFMNPRGETLPVFL